MAIITLAQPRLATLAKKGAPKVLDNGYYEVMLGGLDVTASDGAIYPYKGNASILDPGSVLHRKITKGMLYAEFGHPSKQHGMTMPQWVARYVKVEPTMQCAHIRAVHIDTDYVSPTTGDKFVGILGEIKPAGPYKSSIEEYMDTPDINAAWSVRSLTKNVKMFGTIHKYFLDIITWDFVSEPGIEIATKWDTPSMEESVVTPELMDRVTALCEGGNVSVSVEEADELSKIRDTVKETYGNNTLTMAWNKF